MQKLVCSINYVRNAVQHLKYTLSDELKPTILSISPTFNKKVQRNMKWL